MTGSPVQMMMKLEPIITIININYIHHLLDVFIVSSFFPT